MFRRVYPCLSCRRGIRAPSCTRCAINLARRIPRLVVRFGRHDAFYLWQVWWSAQAGRKGRHELCSSKPHRPPTNHPARPLMQKFFRCAGQIAAPCGARYPSWGEARRKRRQVRTNSIVTFGARRPHWREVVLSSSCASERVRRSSQCGGSRDCQSPLRWRRALPAMLGQASGTRRLRRAAAASIGRSTC